MQQVALPIYQSISSSAVGEVTVMTDIVLVSFQFKPVKIW